VHAQCRAAPRWGFTKCNGLNKSIGAPDTERNFPHREPAKAPSSPTCLMSVAHPPSQRRDQWNALSPGSRRPWRRRLVNALREQTLESPAATFGYNAGMEYFRHIMEVVGHSGGCSGCVIHCGAGHGGRPPLSGCIAPSDRAHGIGNIIRYRQDVGRAILLASSLYWAANILGRSLSRTTCKMGVVLGNDRD